jgi:hypothetical protein
LENVAQLKLTHTVMSTSQCTTMYPEDPAPHLAHLRSENIHKAGAQWRAIVDYMRENLGVCSAREFQRLWEPTVMYAANGRPLLANGAIWFDHSVDGAAAAAKKLLRNTPLVTWEDYAQPKRLYTVALVDPKRQYLHWLVVNATNTTASGTTGTVYSGPVPPAVHDAHRYLLLVFLQSGDMPQVFDANFDTDRLHWDIRGWIRENNLRLVGMSLITGHPGS